MPSGTPNPTTTPAPSNSSSARLVRATPAPAVPSAGPAPLPSSAPASTASSASPAPATPAGSSPLPSPTLVPKAGDSARLVRATPANETEATLDELLGATRETANFAEDAVRDTARNEEAFEPVGRDRAMIGVFGGIATAAVLTLAGLGYAGFKAYRSYVGQESVTAETPESSPAPPVPTMPPAPTPPPVPRPQPRTNIADYVAAFNTAITADELARLLAETTSSRLSLHEKIAVYVSETRRANAYQPAELTRMNTAVEGFITLRLGELNNSRKADVYSALRSYQAMGASVTLTEQGDSAVVTFQNRGRDLKLTFAGDRLSHLEEGAVGAFALPQTPAGPIYRGLPTDSRERAQAENRRRSYEGELGSLRGAYNSAELSRQETLLRAKYSELFR